MKRLIIAGVLLLVGAATIVASADDRRDPRRTLRARLTGFQEPPAVVSTGTGKIKVVIHDDTLASYELEFANLEGTVTQAHIHLGQHSVNGGIMVWLCGTPGATAGPPGTPTCGTGNSGAAAREITAVDVVGPAGQGVSAGEFAEFLLALRTGTAYANVHSTRNPGGEIRGQLHPDFGRD
ncbi:MAG TPA: CHRD domain-containing protein [Gammaproteobacteria bacterium]|jgi:hypothetical protein